jgi:hypothetical protein
MRYLVPALGATLAVVAVLHPWLHQFEGGSLDAAFVYLTAMYDTLRD